MRYYFASWSCSSAPVGAAASCCVVVCVRIEQSRLIDKKTPPLIGRSPRPLSPSLRCRSDSRARFPLTTTLGELGGLGGNDSRAFFSVSVRGCIIVFVVLGNGGSTWPARHYRSAESLPMQRQIEGPAVSVSGSWAWGDGHVPERAHWGRGRSLRDMRRRRERDTNSTTQSLDLPLAGHVSTGGMPALRVLGNARRMPWMRRAPKKGRPGTPRVSGGKQGGSRPGKLSRRVAAAGFRPRCRRSAPMPAPLPQVGGACSP